MTQLAFETTERPRYVLSRYQQDILAAVEAGEENIAVRARAGTGKTHVLCAAVQRMPARARILVVAFNKEIAEELKRKMPVRAEVLTTHSLGLRALKRAFPRSLLRQDRVRDLLRTSSFFPSPHQAPMRHAVGRLVARAKATLARSSAELDALVDDCGVVLDDLVDASRLPRGGLTDEQRADLRAALVDYTGRVLVACGEEPGEHDFDDMLWAPVVHGLVVGQWDRVVVDECQDLSRVQLELIASALAPGGKILVCGDDRQSCYQFRGADAHAFDRLAARFGCRVLPLSLTYRCPRLVVDLAREVVDDYEAAEQAPAGVVAYAPQLDHAQLAPGDFVISRKNAPLVKHAIRLLTLGKPAAIAGRDLARDLGAILRSMVGRVGSDSAAARKWLSDRYDKRIREAAERDLDTQVLQDELACLLALLEARSTPEAAADLLDSLCRDKPGAATTFSSVHRAKGLESDRVYVLASTFRTPHAGTSTPLRCDATEEENLWYISITRAKQTLVLVRSEK